MHISQARPQFQTVCSRRGKIWTVDSWGWFHDFSWFFMIRVYLMKAWDELKCLTSPPQLLMTFAGTQTWELLLDGYRWWKKSCTGAGIFDNTLVWLVPPAPPFQCCVLKLCAPVQDFSHSTSLFWDIFFKPMLNGEHEGLDFKCVWRCMIFSINPMSQWREVGSCVDKVGKLWWRF